jgi:hypothetical protein
VKVGEGGKIVKGELKDEHKSEIQKAKTKELPLILFTLTYFVHLFL